MATEAWPWERDAMHGAPMPSGLGLEDQLAYQAVSLLYQRFANYRLSREQAAAEKEQIRREYRKRMESKAFADRLCSFTVQLWKDIEGASAEYSKHPSIEAADRLIQAIYKVGRKPGGPLEGAGDDSQSGCLNGGVGQDGAPSA